MENTKTFTIEGRINGDVVVLELPMRMHEEFERRKNIKEERNRIAYIYGELSQMNDKERTVFQNVILKRSYINTFEDMYDLLILFKAIKKCQE